MSGSSSLAQTWISLTSCVRALGDGVDRGGRHLPKAPSRCADRADRERVASVISLENLPIPPIPRLPLVPDPLRRIRVPRDLGSVTARSD